MTPSSLIKQGRVLKCYWRDRGREAEACFFWCGRLVLLEAAWNSKPQPVLAGVLGRQNSQSTQQLPSNPDRTRQPSSQLGDLALFWHSRGRGSSLAAATKLWLSSKEVLSPHLSVPLVAFIQTGRCNVVVTYYSYSFCSHHSSIPEGWDMVVCGVACQQLIAAYHFKRAQETSLVVRWLRTRHPA